MMDNGEMIPVAEAQMVIDALRAELAAREDTVIGLRLEVAKLRVKVEELEEEHPPVLEEVEQEGVPV